MLNNFIKFFVYIFKNLKLHFFNYFKKKKYHTIKKIMVIKNEILNFAVTNFF